MRSVRCSSLILSGLLSSCLEYNFDGKEGPALRPDISVTPEMLDFGGLDFGVEVSDVVTVENQGEAPLTLSAIHLGGDEAFTLSAPEGETVLEPGQQTELVVTFTPWSVDDTGLLTIYSDDPNEGSVDVPLSGALNVPMLVFSPDPMDMGGLPIGATKTEDLTITNEGYADLELSSLMLTGDAFTFESPALPLTLSAGESVALPVTFSATGEGTFDGRLWASSNAGTGSDSVAITGVGSSGPVAVCWVDPELVTSHDELPTWIGNESYDPGGAEIVTWSWTLIDQPDGSSVEIPGDESMADREGFEWDLAGAYMGRLIVENEYGQVSDPCDTLLIAAPSDNLWIEMYWEYPQDDMDLHLLAPDGSKWSSLDCHWQNCVDGGLEWGSPSDDTDDPSLDLDDIAGVGPENIRIEEPAAGEYTVLVHDYEASRYRDDNPVTVNIYVGGALVFSETRILSGEDSWESYAYVSFPEGTVTPL